MRIRHLFAGLFTTAAFFAAPGVGAQTSEWSPTRPIKWVHPAAPGGASDVLARMMIERLAKRLGQPIVMEYKPGGGSAIAAEYVLQQPADGHTLFFTTTTFNLYPLMAKARYDAVADFTHLIVVADINMVLASNPNLLKVASPQDLVRWAKANPALASVALPNKGGTGELVMELINLMTGTRLQAIIYKGGAPMMTDVVGGQVPLVVESMATFGEFIKAGKITPILVSGKKRLPNYPQVPTLNETLVPGADVNAWFALQMPRGVPAPVVARLNREVNEVIRDPAIVEAYERGGATMVGGSSAEATQLITNRAAMYARIVKDANLKAE